MKVRRYSPTEDQYIRKHFADITLSDIGRYLGRTVGSIHCRAAILGLKLTDEQRLRNYKIGLSRGWHKDNKGAFPKGHTPWNKGVKGIHLSPTTEFKKGELPYNTKQDGYISIRKYTSGKSYKFIRIANAKWQLYHRYLYQQKHGKIPSGMMIIFKDGNQMNCVIENLQMITYTENMDRNSIQQYPDELRNIILLKGSLTRRINKLNQNHGQ